MMVMLMLMMLMMLMMTMMANLSDDVPVWTLGHLWNGDPTSRGLEIGRKGDSTRSKNSSASHTELLILGVTGGSSNAFDSALNKFTWSSNSVELLFCRMSLT